jgi:hypothetical protein
VTRNCFLDYDGLPTNNKGASWIDNGAAGGSGVRIDNNIVQSSRGRRSIYVGISARNAVSGVIFSNQYLGTAPFSEAPGMTFWSNERMLEPVTDPFEECLLLLKTPYALQ